MSTRHTVPGSMPRTLHDVDFSSPTTDARGYAVQERIESVVDVGRANVVSSIARGDSPRAWSSTHYPVIDIDHPCVLLESSPGKFHLYIDEAVPRRHYFAMLPPWSVPASSRRAGSGHRCAAATPRSGCCGWPRPPPAAEVLPTKRTQHHNARHRLLRLLRAQRCAPRVPTTAREERSTVKIPLAGPDTQEELDARDELLRTMLMAPAALAVRHTAISVAIMAGEQARDALDALIEQARLDAIENARTADSLEVTEAVMTAPLTSLMGLCLGSLHLGEDDAPGDPVEDVLALAATLLDDPAWSGLGVAESLSIPELVVLARELERDDRSHSTLATIALAHLLRIAMRGEAPAPVHDLRGALDTLLLSREFGVASRACSIARRTTGHNPLGIEVLLGHIERITRMRSPAGMPEAKLATFLSLLVGACAAQIETVGHDRSPSIVIAERIVEDAAGRIEDDDWADIGAQELHELMRGAELDIHEAFSHKMRLDALIGMAGAALAWRLLLERAAHRDAAAPSEKAAKP